MQPGKQACSNLHQSVSCIQYHKGLLHVSTCQKKRFAASFAARNMQTTNDNASYISYKCNLVCSLWIDLHSIVMAAMNARSHRTRPQCLNQLTALSSS